MQKLAQEIHAVTPVNTDTNIVVLSGAQGFAQGTREARLPLVLLLATAGLVLLIPAPISQTCNWPGLPPGAVILPCASP